LILCGGVKNIAGGTLYLKKYRS